MLPLAVVISSLRSCVPAENFVTAFSEPPSWFSDFHLFTPKHKRDGRSGRDASRPLFDFDGTILNVFNA